ncbi:right-handed parallel beta-helix repeat-containing protein [Novosphingobium terrae]|uniref:right-handed parallel beta-helix repeat-containing protein n=1 Tax=Novosphingobium terrae TaxID=2726189 RepID=UPI00197F9BFC|nr:right-handed parallel beta-helix repeat-containing protein [Novosphingobium terrae]
MRLSKTSLLLSGLLAGGTALLAAGSPALSQGNAPVVHVAPQGNDSGDGSAAAPLRSIEHARDVARGLRGRGAGGVTIALAGGNYILPRPVVFDQNDSGTLIRPEPGASVRILGGDVLGPWQAGPDGTLSVSNVNSCPSQLFVNGQRRERPRLPQTGFYSIGSVDARSPGGPPVNDHFTARSGDLPDGFAPSAQTEIVVLDAWTASRMWVTGYDPSSRVMWMHGTFAGHAGQANFTPGLAYYLENVPRATLSPGTWQCDPARHTLRYRPMTGENAQSLFAVAPRLGQWFVLRGADGQPLHDFAIRDLALLYAAWATPANGWGAMQGEVPVTAALTMEHCRNITLENVTVAHTGAGGIRIGRDCANVTVHASHLVDLGGGGIAIGSDQRKPQAGSDWPGGTTGPAETHHITIAGNDIRMLGRVQRAAIGIWTGQAHHVTITGNHIADLYYTGISLGWVWSDAPTLSHDNTVTGNTIDNFGQGVLSDFGGIYTLGSMPNTVVDGNRISHGYARVYGGHGLYADEGSSGIRFTHNVVSDLSHAPIQVTDGHDLLFADNQFSNFGEGVIFCYQPAHAASVRFINNSAQANGVPVTRGVCGDKSYDIENLQLIQNGATRRLDKPFGRSDSGGDYVAGKLVLTPQR